MTVFGLGAKTYSDVVKRGVLEEQQHNSQPWRTVMRRRNTTQRRKHFLFLGNLPTKADREEIWKVVKGDQFFTELIIPNKRDKNNNRYAFLQLKPTISPERAINQLHNTKLFGRYLGFALANRAPPAMAHSTETSKTGRGESTPATPTHPKNKDDTETKEQQYVVEKGEITLKSDLEFKNRIYFSLIGVLKSADSADNILEKIMITRIQFISVTAITSHKFLLLFLEEKEF